MSETNKKRRLKNTTNAQYEMYLFRTESDYAFRSSTINPTLGPDYLEKSWTELTNQLKSIGSGPTLSVAEWKKRFQDWKYGVRHKYRKMKCHRVKTGSGPKLDMHLSPLEERGLSVWGKVVVTGAPTDVYDGLDQVASNQVAEATAMDNFIELEPSTSGISNLNLNNDEFIEDGNILTPYEYMVINNIPSGDEPLQNYNKKLENIPAKATKEKQTKATKEKEARVENRKRNKPLSDFVEQFLETNNSFGVHNKQLNKTLKTFTENYIEIGRNKLAFEIAKYKHEHKDFDYNV